MEPVDNGKGAQFTIADDHGPNQLVLHSKQGVYLCSAYDQYEHLKHKIFGTASMLLQTKNSQFLVMGSETLVMVYDLKKKTPVFEKTFNYIYSLSLSPSESYVQVLDKIDSNSGITQLYSLPDMALVAEFKENQHSGFFNKQYYPLVHFTCDDSKYFRYNYKALQVYGWPQKKERELPTGLLEFFEVSRVSTADDYLLICVYLDKKNSEGKCELYTAKSDEPIYRKNIKKVEQVIVKFSPTSNSFLMELQTFFDPTGKSYYGEYGIYLYDDRTNKISTVKAEKGPLHDFSWHRDGQKFVIISGFMPAHAVLISKDNQPIHSFGKKHRNVISWGNLGRFLCLAGFGNLNGEMEIWDLETLKQISYCKSNSASYCYWSPDDRKIMTTIVTPRLRVDNCFKIFSYSGTLLNKMSFEERELYGVFWLNTPEAPAKARGVSPGRKLEAEPKKEQAKFKTFSAAMNLSSGPWGETKVESNKPKLAPGQHPEDAVRKKRKRKNKEAKEKEAS